MAKKRTAKKPAAAKLSYIAEPLRPLAVEISELKLDPRNARQHDDGNLAAIAASLRQFGQLKPIVVNRDTRTIEAGNATFRAAQTLRWSHLAAVFVEHDAAAARGFAIADNRTAELATWDDEILAALLEEMQDDLPELCEDLLLDQLLQSDAGDGEEEATDAAGQAVPAEWQVVVECKSEEDQRKFYERLQKEGRKCRLLTL